MTADAAASAARTAGLVTAPVGLALLVKPRLATWPLDVSPGAARAIGAVDLALAPGLLAANNRAPWMAARAMANVGTAAVCARRGTPAGRAVAAGLALLTLVDGAAAVTLLRAARTR